MDSLRQPVFAIQLKNVEWENFDGSLAERQVCQHYLVFVKYQNKFNAVLTYMSKQFLILDSCYM